MSQEKLAVLVGVSRPSLVHIEGGKRKVSTEELIRFADITIRIRRQLRIFREFRIIQLLFPKSDNLWKPSISWRKRVYRLK